MAERIPFDDDTMTIIMGLGGPEKPGQHGRSVVPAPDSKAIDVITQIRDLCEDFLMTIDKEEKSEEKEGQDNESPEEPEFNKE